MNWQFNYKGRCRAEGKAVLYGSTEMWRLASHITTNGFAETRECSVPPLYMLVHGSGSGSKARCYKPSDWSNATVGELCNGGDIVTLLF